MDKIQSSTFRAVVLSLCGVLTTLLSSTPAMATDPPPTPKVFPPQIWTPSRYVPRPLPQVPFRHVNAHDLANWAITPHVYHAFLADLLAHSEGVSTPIVSAASQSPAKCCDLASLMLRPLSALKPIPQLALASVSNVSQQDSPHEINEASVIVHPQFHRYERRYIDTGAVAFMRADTAPSLLRWRVRVGTTTQFTSPWTLSEPLDISELHQGQTTGFDQSGDPIIASDAFGTVGTFHPRRVYVVGTAFTINPGDNQINVWYTDSLPPAPLPWQVYPGLRYNSWQGYWTDDKPVIAVSQNSQTAGYVYVAFVLASRVGQPSEIHVWRLVADPNDPAYDTWQEVSVPVVGSNDPKSTPQSPRLDVDPATGSLYLSWLDWDANTVNFRVSPGPAGQGTDGSWSPTLSFPSGQLLSYNGRDFICGAATTGCVEARSFLATRFNSVDGSLAVVYHRRKGTYGSEVVMRKFTYPAGSLTNEVVVSNLTSDDQWHGTVDVDSNGKCLVSHYDYDHQDPNVVKYKVYARKVEADGTPIAGEDSTLLYSASAYSDLSRQRTYTFGSGPTQIDYHGLEYQDLWYRGGVWNAVSIYATDTENVADAFVARAQ